MYAIRLKLCHHKFMVGWVGSRAYALKLTKIAVATDDFFQKRRIEGCQ